MLLLRRHYHLSAEQVWGPPEVALPAWEVDWLVASLSAVGNDPEPDPSSPGVPVGEGGLPDPFAAPVAD